MRYKLLYDNGLKRESSSLAEILSYMVYFCINFSTENNFIVRDSSTGDEATVCAGDIQKLVENMCCAIEENYESI